MAITQSPEMKSMTAKRKLKKSTKSDHSFTCSPIVASSKETDISTNRKQIKTTPIKSSLISVGSPAGAIPKLSDILSNSKKKEIKTPKKQSLSLFNSSTSNPSKINLKTPEGATNSKKKTETSEISFNSSTNIPNVSEYSASGDITGTMNKNKMKAKKSLKRSTIISPKSPNTTPINNAMDITDSKIYETFQKSPNYIPSKASPITKKRKKYNYPVKPAIKSLDVTNSTPLKESLEMIKKMINSPKSLISPNVPNSTLSKCSNGNVAEFPKSRDEIKKTPNKLLNRSPHSLNCTSIEKSENKNSPQTVIKEGEPQKRKPYELNKSIHKNKKTKLDLTPVSVLKDIKKNTSESKKVSQKKKKSESKEKKLKVKSDAVADHDSESDGCNIEDESDDNCAESQDSTIDTKALDESSSDSDDQAPSIPTHLQNPIQNKETAEMGVKNKNISTKTVSTTNNNSKGNSLVFGWGSKKKSSTTQQQQEDDSTSEEEELVTQGAEKKRRRVSRRERDQQAVLAEAHLRQVETSRQRNTGGPQSAEDYMELLQANGACSATWIQYTSFLLASGLIGRARATIRKALTVIPAEEQQERLNIWTVLLRLEVMHGTGESVKAAQEEALVCADDFEILTAMAAIHKEAGNEQDSEAVHLRLTKKYYAVTSVWVSLGLFYYTTGKPQQAREALVRAMQALGKKMATDVTSQFAQLELQHGSPARGDAMFESLLANYPNRVDVWNVYADLLVKLGRVDQARTVLHRLCSLPLRLSKKRSAFTKLLTFEKAHGNTKTQEEAKARVKEYTERLEKELEEGEV